MKLQKANSPEVCSSNPWTDDIFSRKATGELLTRIICSVDQPFVIAVNGGWGSGKSVFLRRLCSHFKLATPSIPTITVDAWKNDWHDDPLVALALATNETLELHGFSQTRDIGSRLVGHASNFIAPVTSLIANVVAPGSGPAAGGIAKAGTEAIKLNARRSAAKRSVEMCLGEARDLLLKRQASRPLEGHVAIVIDELDRCRPDYAIKMLERIKHFFSIPGFVFVIATDNVNLRSAVKTVYGSETDGEQYLRRFFDFEVHLRAPTAGQYTTALCQQFNVPSASWPNGQTVRLIQSERFYSNAGSDPENIWAEAIEEFTRTAQRFGLSLRDQAQAFSLLAAMISTHGKRRAFLPPVAAFLACLRFGDERAFDRIKLAGDSAFLEALAKGASTGGSGVYMETLSQLLSKEEQKWSQALGTLRGNILHSNSAERIAARIGNPGEYHKLRPAIADMVYMVDSTSD